uniref:Zinc finger piccolo-type domain-containing protein n=1 Tax=Knipowitschia caucasica TaxID=637954 RepID=A0AAV2LXC6_KNICA
MGMQQKVHQQPSHLDKGPAKHQEAQPIPQQQPVPVAVPVVKETPAPPPPEPEKPKVNCPLCKTELNIGSSDPPNYNSCTQCHSQVCNLCGFNPTPHLVELPPPQPW